MAWLLRSEPIAFDLAGAAFAAVRDKLPPALGSSNPLMKLGVHRESEPALQPVDARVLGVR